MQASFYLPTVYVGVSHINTLIYHTYESMHNLHTLKITHTHYTHWYQGSEIGFLLRRKKSELVNLFDFGNVTHTERG